MKPLLPVAALAIAAATIWLLASRDERPAPDPDPGSASSRPGEARQQQAGAERRAVEPTTNVVPMTPLVPATPIEGLLVTGRVLDATARPLAGVALTFLPPRDAWLDGDASGSTRVASGATGVDGRFALRIEEPRELVLLVEHPRYPSASYVIEPRDRAVVELGEVVLHTSLGLVVELVDAERGQPVAGARITVAPVLFDPLIGGALAQRRIVATARDGKGVVYGIGAGDWTVRVEADGRATSELVHQQPEAAAITPVLRVVLGEGHALGGRVLGPMGEPVPGAMVTITTGDGGATVVTSGTAGEFRAVGLPVGRLQVRAETAAFEPVEQNDVPSPAATPLLLRFDRGLALAGRIVDAGDGTPVEGVVVTALPDGGPPLVRAHRIVRPATRSGRDGSFLVEGLPAGRFRLSFSSDRHASQRSDVVEPTRDPDRTAVFSLREAPLVELVVRDANGRPLPHAELEMLPADHDGTAFAELLCRATRDAPAQTVRTDEHGRAALRAKSPRFRLHATAADHASALGEIVTLDLTATKVRLPDVTLDRGATVLGRCVRAGGSPAPDALVQADPVGGDTPRRFARTRADSSGRFAFPPLPAGDWELSFVPAEESAARESAHRFAATRIVVTLRDGQRLEQEILER